jgi:hypothetical protein
MVGPATRQPTVHKDSTEFKMLQVPYRIELGAAAAHVVILDVTRNQTISL